MKSSVVLIGVMAFLPLLPSGCATITKSSDQLVTVNTRPAGAECVLERNGETIAVIHPTPGTISVQKNKNVIHVSCQRPNYLQSEGELASEFESMTFGNIIFGGIVGVAVDAASGAMHDYPPLVTITLIPEAFESDEQRDTFFDRMRDELLDESVKVKDRIRKKCMDEDCDKQLAAADAATQSKLANIEAKRASARISVEVTDIGVDSASGQEGNQ